MGDLNVWFADADGFYTGELHAVNATESFGELAADAFTKGLITLDAMTAARPPTRTPTPLFPPAADGPLLADVATCKAFLANATPVAADVVQAEKALIRIVARLVRELT